MLILMFISWNNIHKFIIIAIYVDDTIVASNNLALVTNIKTEMATLFEMSLLGHIHFLLGTQIIKNNIRG
jgi:hypothetical protein